MAFSKAVIERAFYKKANGHCQICGKQLVFEHRGRNGGRGSWEAHHSKPQADGGKDTYANCTILCYQCHQQPQRAVLQKAKSKSVTTDDLLFGNTIKRSGNKISSNNKKKSGGLGGGLLW